MFRYRIDHIFYSLRFYDSGLIAVSYFMSFYLSEILLFYFNTSESPYTLQDHFWLLIAAIPIWIVTLGRFGAYKVYRNIEGNGNGILLKSCGISLLILSALSILVKPNNASIIFTANFFLISSILLTLGRKLITIVLAYRSRNKMFCRNILVIGTGVQARNYTNAVKSHPEWGVTVCGYIDDFVTESVYHSLNEKVIGKISELPYILESQVIDEVVVAVPTQQLVMLEEVIESCEEFGIDVTVATIPCGVSIAKVCYSELCDTPLMVLSMTSCSQVQLFIKNMFDFVASLGLLLVLSPLMLMVACCIKLDSKGPVLFTQTRCGLQGRRFKMYKFRSMYIDADKKLAEVIKYNQADGPVFKMKNDPRVTRVGRWLRKVSIDELPQLINVLHGEMSLIGPRPPLPHEILEYQGSQRRRLSVVPGITGLSQVSGRSDIDFKKWIEFDLSYIDNWSLWLDLKILFRTIPAVILRKGAY